MMLVGVSHYWCKKNNPTNLDAGGSCSGEAALSRPDHKFILCIAGKGRKKSFQEDTIADDIHKCSEQKKA